MGFFGYTWADIAAIMPFLIWTVYWFGVGLCFIHEWNRHHIFNKIRINGVIV